MADTRQKLTFGMPIATQGGWDGRLHGLLVRLEDQTIIAGLLQDLHSPEHLHVVHLAALDQGDEAIPGFCSLELGCEQPSAQQGTLRLQHLLREHGMRLRDVPRGRQTLFLDQYVGPALAEHPSRLLVAAAAEPGCVTLAPRHRIWRGPRQFGVLEGVIVDGAGAIQQLLVRRKGLWRSRVVIPIAAVDMMDAQQIMVADEADERGALLPYRTDAILRKDVRQALSTDAQLRGDRQTIDARVQHGHVTLRGYVMDGRNTARAATLVQQVMGVLGVTNQLISDAEVEQAVTAALARSTDIRSLDLSFSSRRGIVRIEGPVASAAEHALVEQVCGAVPIVRGVINRCTAPGMPPLEREQRALFPGIGQTVYAQDGRIGSVAQVILGAHHRRVEALVVTLDRATSLDWAYLSETPPVVKQHQVVVPIEVVEDATVAGVFLAVPTADVRAYAAYASRRYRTPDESWVPPYPYTRSDSVFERHQEGAAAGTEAREKPVQQHRRTTAQRPYDKEGVDATTGQRREPVPS